MNAEGCWRREEKIGGRAARTLPTTTTTNREAQTAAYRRSHRLRGCTGLGSERRAGVLIWRVWVSLWNRIWGHERGPYLKVSLFTSISIDPSTLSSSFKQLSSRLLSFSCVSSSPLFLHHSVVPVQAKSIPLLSSSHSRISFSIFLCLFLALAWTFKSGQCFLIMFPHDSSLERLKPVLFMVVFFFFFLVHFP